jgi:16S rRNA (guanine966-N2)-methyltransferase
MRIVGGEYRGRIFIPDKKFSARPTTDLAKEALFNILSNRYDFEGMTILDLFSGTGSIGYEFISRGATEVTFVEKNNHHIGFIRGVIQKLDIKNARVIRDDVFKFIKNCKTRFDIIFLDPPFDMERINDLPDLILKSNLLKNNGIMILEHSRNYDFSGIHNFTDTRRYGKVNFSFFSAEKIVSIS